jgi:ATP-dependent Clp protease protease subunit
MKILANHTGKDADQVRADCDRDYWMSAEEALNYGLIDKILVKTSKTDDQGE